MGKYSCKRRIIQRKLTDTCCSVELFSFWPFLSFVLWSLDTCLNSLWHLYALPTDRHILGGLSPVTSFHALASVSSPWSLLEQGVKGALAYVWSVFSQPVGMATHNRMAIPNPMSYERKRTNFPLPILLPNVITQIYILQMGESSSLLCY